MANSDLRNMHDRIAAQAALWPGFERQHLERAITILHNMALENRSPWKRFFRRWYISDEPLRNDAARFLKDLGVERMTPVAARVYDPERY